MNGFDIAENMWGKVDTPLDEVIKVLDDGDGGDKLYASVFLLEKKFLAFRQSVSIIKKNCSNVDLCTAWVEVAHYIHTAAAFMQSICTLQKTSPDSIPTFIYLSPIFLRPEDTRSAIDFINQFLLDNPIYAEDFREVCERILARKNR